MIIIIVIIAVIMIVIMIIAIIICAIVVVVNCVPLLSSSDSVRLSRPATRDGVSPSSLVLPLLAKVTHHTLF